jgi:hypothetical protein
MTSLGRENMRRLAAVLFSWRCSPADALHLAVARGFTEQRDGGAAGDETPRCSPPPRAIVSALVVHSAMKRTLIILSAATRNSHMGTQYEDVHGFLWLTAYTSLSLFIVYNPSPHLERYISYFALLSYVL